MNIQSNNLINNPLTFYKLDPGEPGIAPPTPASKSVFTVFSQEARNRQRLKAEAMMEGKDVVFLNTEYKVRKNGSYYTPVGGTTTIVTRDREQKKEDSLELDKSTDKDKNSTSNVKQIDQLDIKENSLRMEQKKLKTQLRSADGEEKQKIEKRLQEIENELKKIQQLKEEKEDNSDTANNKNALFGLSESLNNPAGQLIDLLV